MSYQGKSSDEHRWGDITCNKCRLWLIICYFSKRKSPGMCLCLVCILKMDWKESIIQKSCISNSLEFKLHNLLFFINSSLFAFSFCLSIHLLVLLLCKITSYCKIHSKHNKFWVNENMKSGLKGFHVLCFDLFFLWKSAKMESSMNESIIFSQIRS